MIASALFSFSSLGTFHSANFLPRTEELTRDRRLVQAAEIPSRVSSALVEFNVAPSASVSDSGNGTATDIFDDDASDLGRNNRVDQVRSMGKLV